MADQTIQTIQVELLQPNPFQPRDKIKKEDVEELAGSIKQYGVLEPLVVADTPAGLQIIAGERRWRASQLAGLTEVPVIVKKVTPKQMLELAIIENVQRTDLGPLERAQAFQQLMRDFNYNVGEISERLNKSSSYISNCLKLLKLPDAIKDGLAGELITEGHARAIAGIDSQQVMVEMYKQILKENASVRRAEEIARTYRQQTSTSPMVRIRPSVTKVDDQKFKEWEARLKELLESKSSIKLTRSTRQTRVVITLSGDPEDTQKDLEKLMSVQLTTKK